MNDITTLGNADERPLPLIVAENWGFKLDYILQEDTYWFAIPDWIVGLLSTDTLHASKVWSEMKTCSLLDSSVTTRSIYHTRKDGRKFATDYTNDKGLYLIAQHLRSNKNRPLLKEIKVFLSKAGAFADQVRRKPETVVESGAIDPDSALDAIIKMYQRQGKSEEWIWMRMNTKIHRLAFISALKGAMTEVVQFQYGQATNHIYLGLWQRTARRLKEEMELPKTANLRDHQPMAALYYQGLAEDGCARELGDKQELTWGEAIAIIQDVAQFIGEQARAYGERYHIDIATGRPLLGRSIG